MLPARLPPLAPPPQTAYSVIEPGTTRLYRTYVTHPWIVRDAASGARMLLSGAPAVVGMAVEQTVTIAEPRALAWTVRGAHARGGLR